MATYQELLNAPGVSRREIQTFQEALLRIDPNALPQYGADGYVGQETFNAASRLIGEREFESIAQIYELAGTDMGLAGGYTVEAPDPNGAYVTIERMAEQALIEGGTENPNQAQIIAASLAIIQTNNITINGVLCDETNYQDARIHVNDAIAIPNTLGDGTPLGDVDQVRKVLIECGACEILPPQQAPAIVAAPPAPPAPEAPVAAPPPPPAPSVSVRDPEFNMPDNAGPREYASLANHWHFMVGRGERADLAARWKTTWVPNRDERAGELADYNGQIFTADLNRNDLDVNAQPAWNYGGFTSVDGARGVVDYQEGESREFFGLGARRDYRDWDVDTESQSFDESRAISAFFTVHVGDVAMPHYDNWNRWGRAIVAEMPSSPNYFAAGGIDYIMQGRASALDAAVYDLTNANAPLSESRAEEAAAVVFDYYSQYDNPNQPLEIPSQVQAIVLDYYAAREQIGEAYIRNDGSVVRNPDVPDEVREEAMQQLRARTLDRIADYYQGMDPAQRAALNTEAAQAYADDLGAMEENFMVRQRPDIQQQIRAERERIATEANVALNAFEEIGYSRLQYKSELGIRIDYAEEHNRDIFDARGREVEVTDGAERGTSDYSISYVNRGLAWQESFRDVPERIEMVLDNRLDISQGAQTYVQRVATEPSNTIERAFARQDRAFMGNDGVDSRALRDMELAAIQSVMSNPAATQAFAQGLRTNSEMQDAAYSLIMDMIKEPELYGFDGETARDRDAAVEAFLTNELGLDATQLRNEIERPNAIFFRHEGWAASPQYLDEAMATITSDPLRVQALLERAHDGKEGVYAEGIESNMLGAMLVGMAGEPGLGTANAVSNALGENAQADYAQTGPLNQALRSLMLFETEFRYNTPSAYSWMDNLQIQYAAGEGRQFVGLDETPEASLNGNGAAATIPAAPQSTVAYTDITGRLSANEAAFDALLAATASNAEASRAVVQALAASDNIYTQSELGSAILRADGVRAALEAHPALLSAYDQAQSRGSDVLASDLIGQIVGLNDPTVNTAVAAAFASGRNYQSISLLANNPVVAEALLTNLPSGAAANIASLSAGENAVSQMELLAASGSLAVSPSLQGGEYIRTGSQTLLEADGMSRSAALDHALMAGLVRDPDTQAATIQGLATRPSLGLTLVAQAAANDPAAFQGVIDRLRAEGRGKDGVLADRLEAAMPALQAALANGPENVDPAALASAMEPISDYINSMNDPDTRNPQAYYNAAADLINFTAADQTAADSMAAFVAGTPGAAAVLAGMIQDNPAGFGLEGELQASVLSTLSANYSIDSIRAANDDRLTAGNLDLPAHLSLDVQRSTEIASNLATNKPFLYPDEILALVTLTLLPPGGGGECIPDIMVDFDPTSGAKIITDLAGCIAFPGGPGGGGGPGLGG